MTYSHGLDTDIDQETIAIILSALQDVSLPIPASMALLATRLEHHQLLGADGIQHHLDEPSLLALLRAIAAWRPDLAVLLASEALRQTLALPSDHGLALHAWPQANYWRLARPCATPPPTQWCWWWQGRLLHASAADFRDVGLQMRECSVGHVHCLRPGTEKECELIGRLGAALLDGIAEAAMIATESHVQSRHMFHRHMIELPAIAWRVRQARGLLADAQYGELRIELEQLQGGSGFMQESIGSQWLDWLFWATSLPPAEAELNAEDTGGVYDGNPPTKGKV